MTWADDRICGFDTETTGGSPEVARMVSATIVFVGGGKPTDTFKLLIDPGIDIPAESTAFHGITTEHARIYGREPALGAEAISQKLAEAWSAGMPVVGFNIKYDLTVLDRELRRHCGTSLTLSGPVVDPHVIDQALDIRKGKRILEETCRHYNVRLDAAHDATQDALAAARLAWRLAVVYPAEVGNVDPAELHEKQVIWVQEWVTRMNEYWRSRGRNDVKDGSWPVELRPT